MARQARFQIDRRVFAGHVPPRFRTDRIAASNPGLLSRDEMLELRPVNASLGMMLESTSRH
jgi:hypothetical protein